VISFKGSENVEGIIGLHLFYRKYVYAYQTMKMPPLRCCTYSWKQREAVTTHNQSRLGWFDFFLFLFKFLSSLILLPLSTTVRYSLSLYIQRSPISWLQYEVQFYFSVLTLNCRYIIHSLVLPRVTLVRLILEITCELNILQDTLCR